MKDNTKKIQEQGDQSKIIVGDINGEEMSVFLTGFFSAMPMFTQAEVKGGDKAVIAECVTAMQGILESQTNMNMTKEQREFSERMMRMGTAAIGLALFINSTETTPSNMMKVIEAGAVAIVEYKEKFPDANGKPVAFRVTTTEDDKVSMAIAPITQEVLDKASVAVGLDKKDPFMESFAKFKQNGRN